MKQVIFAIALLAMASLTGCLTDDESSVDDNTDTTSDNTGNTNDNSNENTDTNQDNKDDEKDENLIDPIVNSNITSPDLTEIELLLNSINGQLSELENITTALEKSNEQMENSYYQPEEQSSVDIAGIEISKNGKSITVDCSDRIYDDLILEIYTNNQILIMSDNNHWSGALYGCHQSSKVVDLKREPVIACITYFNDLDQGLTNVYENDEVLTGTFSVRTCNTF